MKIFVLPTVKSCQRFYGVLLFVFIFSSSFSLDEGPDWVFYNGKIFTGDRNTPYVEALAITNGIITAIGDYPTIAKLTNGHTRQIDLKGNLVIPGINDAHFHLTPKPDGKYLVLSEPEPTWLEVKNKISEAVKNEKPGTWIFGTIGGDIVNDPQATRFTLDTIAPEHPVFLSAYFGHGYLLNSQALLYLGLKENEASPAGGYYEHVSGSTIMNGKIYEYASWNLSRKLAEGVSLEAASEQYKEFGKEFLRLGITSIQNMSMLPAGKFMEGWVKADIPVRMRIIRLPMTTVDGRMKYEDRNLPIHPDKSRPVKVTGTKWILDGTPIERGAAMRNAYLDSSGWFGKLNFEEAIIDSMIRECLVWNDQLLTHCTGDLAIETVFNAMEKEGKNINWPERRFRIEHGDWVTHDLLARAKKLGVVVVQNPTHFTLVDLFNTRYGPDMPALPLATLINNGIPVALGSDGPFNPYLNIMLAVMHPAHPSEAITREQAVSAYTLGSAFAEFEESSKGTLTVGKFADLAVLSQNIFEVPLETLPATYSILTMIEGKIVYNEGVLF